MPYVYAQAQLASRVGHPMVRPLFFEYREDPTSWLTEHQYMFGTDLLVAPLMEEGRDRGPTCPRGAGQTSRAAAPTTVGRGIDSLPVRFHFWYSSGTARRSLMHRWRKAPTGSIGVDWSSRSSATRPPPARTR